MNQKLRKNISALLSALLFLGTVACNYCLMEKSMYNTPFFDPLYMRTPDIVFLNLGTWAILLSLLVVLTNRVWLGCCMLSGAAGIIAVINFFVLHLHGMPLSFLVVKNARTAMNVVGGINFVFDPQIIALLLITGVLGLAGLLTGFIQRYLLKVSRLQGKTMWLRTGLLTALCAAVLFTCYTGPNHIKPDGLLRWEWTEGYGQYGFAPCTVESFQLMMRGVNQPEGYDQKEADALSVTNGGHSSGQTPDVLLILNETFYDLQQITDPAPDIPYLSNIESLDNCLQGYAVAPAAGGSTNSSEYELLTSNSTYLMPGVTPFHTLDLTDANSIASHLARLGYTTMAAHSERSTNYNRGMSYPALGFQTTHFAEDFLSREYHFTRGFITDESLYTDFLQWYNAASEDAPRFGYLLTIQNHGPWSLNPPEADLVHTTADFGDYTDDVNEFLTGMYMSDLAFKSLTEQLSRQNRPVIVCMMGDHSPTFAREIADTRYTAEELNLRLRAVPLVIWANFPLTEQDLGTMSMNMVVPTLLELAGISRSGYYDSMLQLKEQVPIVSAYGKYFDAEGTMYDYTTDEGQPYADAVDGYLALEYQNIKTRKNRAFYLPYN